MHSFVFWSSGDVVLGSSFAFSCYVFYLSFLFTGSRRDELNFELTTLSHQEVVQSDPLAGITEA